MNEPADIVRRLRDWIDQVRGHVTPFEMKILEDALAEIERLSSALDEQHRSRSPAFTTSDCTQPVVPTGNEGRAGERDTEAMEAARAILRGNEAKEFAVKVARALLAQEGAREAVIEGGVTRPMIEFRQQLREEREAEVRAVTIEECAKLCEEHADFCHNEAHSGGDFQHVVTRRAEATYLAKRIRALAARKEQ